MGGCGGTRSVVLVLSIADERNFIELTSVTRSPLPKCIYTLLEDDKEVGAWGAQVEMIKCLRMKKSFKHPTSLLVQSWWPYYQNKQNYASMNTCIHTYIQACKHQSVQTNMHPSIHQFIHICMEACTRTYIHTYHKHIHMHIEKKRHMYTYTYRYVSCEPTVLNTYK